MAAIQHAKALYETRGYWLLAATALGIWVFFELQHEEFELTFASMAGLTILYSLLKYRQELRDIVG